ncbi:hypothetical protein LWM68_43380 [Niabella sp. W65]|nr:hypothetical protein [Niabella sp. W65]MCH7368978.1 hypothetical protein [Niabella sp. W65]
MVRQLCNVLITAGASTTVLYIQANVICLPENDPQNYLMPWYTHDLALTQKLAFKRTCFVTAVEVNNLFNQYYDVVINYPMPGRNYL